MAHLMAWFVIAHFAINFILLKVFFAEASGRLEFSVSSPQTVILETTVCSDFKCFTTNITVYADNLSPSTFRTGNSHENALHRLNIHLMVFDPVSKEVLGTKHNKPDLNLADTGSIYVNARRSFNVVLKWVKQCDQEFYGKYCEVHCVDELESNKVCSENGKHTCIENWTGLDCSERIDICDIANPCLNDGICSFHEGHGFECSCLEEFSGSLCEDHISTSTSNAPTTTTSIETNHRQTQTCSLCRIIKLNIFLSVFFSVLLISMLVCYFSRDSIYFGWTIIKESCYLRPVEQIATYSSYNDNQVRFIRSHIIEDSNTAFVITEEDLDDVSLSHDQISSTDV